MVLEPGQVIDRYRVEALLGQGGMARVYRVTHVQLGSLHALKVLSVPGADLTRRLLLEGRAQARLRHPNVVAVTDVVEVAGLPGLVLEYIDGPNLAQLISERALSERELDDLAVGILRGVAAAHALGLAHRDLKPANVLLAQDGGVYLPKVADFGLVKLLEGERGPGATRSGVPMGTPSYMAPEQIRDAASADHRADVFSLGALLFELVTGQVCFPGTDVFEVFQKVITGERPKLRADLPARWREAIDGALVVDREQRITDVRTLLEVWRGERSLLPLDALPLGPSETWAPGQPLASTGAAPSGRRGWLPALLGLPVLAGAAFWAAFQLTTPAPPAPPLDDRAVPAAQPPTLTSTPTPTPTPPVPSEPAPDPRPLAAEPAPAARPLPAPRRVEPTAAPAPAAAPDPEPAAPAEASRDEGAPPAPPVTAVNVEGDVKRVYLRARGTARLQEPGPVEPGDYELMAVFRTEPEVAFRFQIEPGQRVVFRCVQEMNSCARLAR